MATATAASSPAQVRVAPATPGTPSTPSKLASRPDPSLKAAKSESQLSRMALTGTPSRGRSFLDTDSFDTRTASPSTRTPSADSQHPDLSNEVALLSTKLINAINHQTTIDDSLQQARHELEAARRKIAEFEAKTREHARLIENGALIRKTKVDATLQAMREELSDAQKQRDVAEKSRKEMEVELETLTSALFEEANTMVAAARKDTESTERKNAQLRSQLQDTELLLASQQEQLADLKNVMERMTSERDETDTLPRSSTAPSTPGADTASKMSNMFDTFPMSPNTPNFGETPPDQPLRFSHLITPVMRSDVQAYTDFAELLKSSRAANPPHSRGSSGVGFSASGAFNSSAPLSAASPTIPGSFSSGAASSPRDASFAAALPPLKDNKFYKRCLVEDVEPALRLDLAPGLSWLARRTVIGAITAGTFVVEPFIPQSKFYGNVYACSLCGESRRTEPHTRRHRFRTSEDDSAQRYPLCEYCLGRVRATCDFLGFLRMVRDGLWRARNDDDINSAWEEAVRLREKMFWARLGGGVVPVVSARSESPNTTQRRNRASLMRQDSSHSSNATRVSRDDGTSSFMSSPNSVLGVPRIQDPFQSRSPKLSALSTSISNDEPMSDAASDGVDTSDFAATHNSAQEMPSTPTIGSDKQQAHVIASVDGPSTPKEQMIRSDQLEPPSPQVDGASQEAEDVPMHSEQSSSDEPAPVSSIPGSFD